MAGILMKILRAGINPLFFVGNDYTFCKSGCGEGEAERKCHNLDGKKSRKKEMQIECEDRMKRLNFMNKSLRQKNEEKANINHRKQLFVDFL